MFLNFIIKNLRKGGRFPDTPCIMSNNNWNLSILQILFAFVYFICSIPYFLCFLISSILFYKRFANSYLSCILLSLTVYANYSSIKYNIYNLYFLHYLFDKSQSNTYIYINVRSFSHLVISNRASLLIF